MAPTLEGMKIAERTGMSTGALLVAMGVAGALGAVAAFWAILHCMYSHGATAGMLGPAHWFGAEAWTRVEGFINAPKGPDGPRIWGLAGGLAFAIGLATMRLNLAWWPFHPVGYAISGSWSMDQLWFAMFLGWLAKAAILRYGGAKAYRPAVPLFVGLVVGEFVDRKSVV